MEQTPEEPSHLEDAVDTKSTTVAGINTLAVLLLVIIASFFFSNEQTREERIGDLEPRDGVPGTSYGDLNERSFVSNSENIRLDLPSDWNVIDSKDIKYIPEGIEDPIFSFRNHDASCTIIYASISKDAWQNFKQVSFTERVFSPDWQFDGNWWILADSTTNEILFSNHERQYLEGEFMISNLFRRHGNSFILFNESQTPVYEESECEQAMNQMLKTVQYFYSPIKLDKSSDGALWVVKEFSNEGARETEPRTSTRILFTPAGSDENFEVLVLPVGVGVSHNFYIYNSRIYFISRDFSYIDGPQFDSSINSINPLSVDEGMSTVIDHSDGYISSAYLYKSKLFYLLGDNDLAYCLDGSADCTADLQVIDLDNGKSGLLLRDTVGGSILGFNKEEDALYLSDGWVDAGCIKYQFSKYVGGSEESIGEYSGCSGDGEYDEMKQVLDSINEKVGKSNEEVVAVKIENGGIYRISEVPEAKESRISFITFVFGGDI